MSQIFFTDFLRLSIDGLGVVAKSGNSSPCVPTATLCPGGVGVIPGRENHCITGLELADDFLNLLRYPMTVGR